MSHFKSSIPVIMNITTVGIIKQEKIIFDLNGMLTFLQIADGVMKVADEVSRKQPQCSILILSLLPRGKNPNVLRVRNNQVNEIIQSQSQNHQRMQYLDLTEGFVSSDGTISTSDMYDYLHLTKHGYEKIVTPLVDELRGLLGD